MTNRTILPLEAFAKDAETALTGAPIAGQSYRNEGLSDQKKGWGFQEVVESQNFNQTMYLTTSLIKQLSDQGILDFSESIAYSKGSVIKFNDSCFIALAETALGENPLNSEKWLDLSTKSTIKWTGKIRLNNFYKIAEIESDNGYFSSILRFTIKRANDTSFAATLFLSSNFSDNGAAIVNKPRATIIQLDAYSGDELISKMISKLIRYTNEKDTLEIEILDGLNFSQEYDIDCEMLLFSGNVIPITTLSLAEPTSPSPLSDPRNSALSYLAKDKVSINNEVVYTSKTIPTATSSKKGVVRLADSLDDPDTDVVSLALLKSEINALKANSFAVDATYVDMTTQRVMATSYVNDTANAILVNLNVYRNGQSTTVDFYVDDVKVHADLAGGNNTYPRKASVTVLVPAGSTYRAQGSVITLDGRSGWFEFRSASARASTTLAKDKFYYSQDGNIFESFDEKLSKEEAAEHGFTVAHLSYDEFTKISEAAYQEIDA